MTHLVARNSNTDGAGVITDMIYTDEAGTPDTFIGTLVYRPVWADDDNRSGWKAFHAHSTGSTIAVSALTTYAQAWEMIDLAERRYRAGDKVATFPTESQMEPEDAIAYTDVCHEAINGHGGVCHAPLNENGTCPGAVLHLVSMHRRDRDDALREAARQLGKALDAQFEIGGAEGDLAYDVLLSLHGTTNTLLNNLRKTD